MSENTEQIVFATHTIEGTEIKPSADLSDCNLRGLIIKAEDLADCNLKEANLSKTRIIGERLQHVDFSQSHMDGVTFEVKIIDTCKFHTAYCSNVNMKAIELRNSNFEDTYLGSVDLTDGKIVSCNFKNCNFSELVAPRLDIIGGTYTDCHFRDCNLVDSEISYCRFETCQFSACDFNKAGLYSDFDHCQMTDNTFEYTKFSWGLYSCDMSGSSFKNADIENVEISKCNWYGCYGIMTVTGLGSMRRIVYFVQTEDGVQVKAGCFNGSVERLLEHSLDTHGGKRSPLYQGYKQAAALAEIVFKSKW